MKKKISLSLPAFGAHGPYMPERHQAQNIFPLSNYSNGVFDLDYSSLLVADLLKIDKISYEAAMDDKRPYFYPMRDSLKILLDAGYLEIVDFSQYVNTKSELIEDTIAKELQIPEYWISIIRHQWELYKPEQKKIAQIIDPEGAQVLERIHFGVFAATEGYTGSKRIKEAIRLQNLLESAKSRNFTVLEREALCQIIRPFLSHSLACHEIANASKAPFLDWTDTDPIHRKFALAKSVLQSSNAESKHNQVKTLQSLFRVSVPELQINSAKTFVNFMKKKSAISSLRRQIIELLQENQPVDADLGIKIRNEANKAQLTAAKRARVISFVGSFLGLGATAPIMEPLMSGLGDTIATAGINTGEQTVSENSSKASTEKYRWYYTLLEMAHENK